MSIKNPQAVLFDLDGTLLDTAPTFAKHLNILLIKYGKKPLAADIIRDHVSHGVSALITLGFGLTEGQENFETLRNEFLDLYEKNIEEGTQLFEGMEEVLETLAKKNIPWGIVTNKPSRFTFPLINKLGISKQCSVITCPDDVKNAKPSPEPLLLACFRLNVDAKNCIYVGDHDRDIQAGKAAGMYTVSALFGYIGKNDHPENWNANLEIQHAKELLTLLK